MRRAIARLIDAYKDDLITKKEFEPRVRQSENRQTQLQEEQAKLLIRANEQEELRSVINHLDEFAKKLTDGIEKLSWSDKREVIRALVKRVEVGKEEVRVVYKIGQLPFVHGPASGASLQHCWRRDHRALWTSFLREYQLPVVQNPCFQPHLDQLQQAAICHPLSQDR